MIFLAMTVAFAAALSRIQRLVDRHNDVCNAHLIGFACKGISPTWTAGTFDDIETAQFAEQLL
jgi:uncharacterized membrane protein YjjP (DUF1212 family)